MRVLLLSLLLIGCSTTVPVKPRFPDAPDVLKEKCERLKTVDANDKVAITEMLKVIVTNYGLYYECSSKVEGWQEWYNNQKKIYEDIK